MRRLKRNKRGFTLTEIILVIAIIVILTAALAAGIAIDLNRYKQYLANLNTSGGGNWEGDARGRVAGMFGTVDPAPENNGDPTPLPTANASEEADETEEAVDTEVPAPPTENAGDPTDAPPTQGPTQAPPTVKPADPTQAPSGGGGGTTNFNTSQGTHWDANDHRDNPWGSNVPDTTSKGSVSFGSSSVSNFTIKVNGDVMSYSCDNWKYGIKDNGDGTYTISYKANDYSYNPPDSSVGLTFKVNGDKAADIEVISYTEYK